jgi:hypothetical protein
MDRVREVLKDFFKDKETRERSLPPHVMVMYTIAMALNMHCAYREVLRLLLEGLKLTAAAVDGAAIRVATKSAISRARARLGYEAMKRLHDEFVKPIATPQTKGAFFRNWHLVSVDGTTLNVQDLPSLEADFGRPKWIASRVVAARVVAARVHFRKSGFLGCERAGCIFSSVPKWPDVE